MWRAKPSDEVVLAAVRFVGDHHNVSALRQHRVAIPFFLRKKFLDRGEHHAAGRNSKLCPQVRAVGGLYGRLAQ